MQQQVLRARLEIGNIFREGATLRNLLPHYLQFSPHTVLAPNRTHRTPPQVAVRWRTEAQHPGREVGENARVGQQGEGGREEGWRTEKKMAEPLRSGTETAPVTSDSFTLLGRRGGGEGDATPKRPAVGGIASPEGEGRARPRARPPVVKGDGFLVRLVRVDQGPRAAVDVAASPRNG